MRIARLELHAFGPFTNARLDFAHKPRALQLVYGPNEAGKSSTLRAVIALLYGIPVRTVDAHVHEMNRLRIGGILLDEQGNRHEVVRRKGMKHTLLGAKDKPLPDDSLHGLLGGLDENLFRQMFGLDHERLRQGAEALLEGGGNLGEGLFDAGTGARTIRAAMLGLAQEADALFRARGRTPKLNAAIDALREHQRAQREAALSPQAFLEQQRGLTEAREARESRAARRRALFEEKARLSRAISLIPLLTRRASLVAPPDSQLEPGDPLEAWDAEHKRLTARFQATRRVEAELPGDRARAQRLTQEIAELKGRVLSAGELHGALDTPTRSRIRKLAESHEALQRELQQAVRAQVEQAAAHALVTQQLSSWERLEPPHELARLVDRIERDGLERELLNLELELSQAQRALNQRAKALGVGADLTHLANLAVPDDVALLKLETTRSELDEADKRLHASERELAQRASTLGRQRDLLLTRGEPASPSALREAREQRTRAYHELRRAVSAGTHDEQDFRALEASVQLSDELADRMQREAEQVFELLRIEAEERALEREQQALVQAKSAQQVERAALVERLRALSESLGLSHVPGAELRGQVFKLGQVSEQAGQILARLGSLDMLSERVAEAGQRLERALGREPQSAHDGAGGAGARLAHALGAAKAEVEARLAAQRELDKSRARRDEFALTREAVGARAEALSRELDGARESFRAELRKLGLSETLGPDEALSSLDELVELERKGRELTGLRARIEGAVADLAGLASDVHSLVRRVEPALASAEGTETGILLEGLEQTLRTRREARRDQEERARELQKINEQLVHSGDGSSVDELRQQVQGLEPDRSRARLLELEDELEQLDQEIAELNQAIGSKEAGLNLLEQPSGAVSLAEEVQSDLSHVRQLVRRYLEVRLSQALLKREVDLYRTQHQGPVLARANQLFPRLTLQRYRGLDVEFDERDEAVLCAVRQDGKTVRVAGLSDGTRDQLYLALRVASIERFLQHNSPLPLILDDAFVHFDDQRAEAALVVLAELCARTQVLLFTHHHRMVELAKNALGRDGMILHELDPARGVINLRDDGPLFARL
ncbi:MAG: AAA family ATPase [Myxococcales bacterium]